MMKIEDELLDIEGIKKSNKPLIDLFIRRTAVLTCTPENLVDKIIKDQWRHANKVTQAGVQVAEIDFCNLGTFYISPSKVTKRIAKLLSINKTLSERTEVDDKEKKKNELIILKNLSSIRGIKIKTKQTNEY